VTIALASSTPSNSIALPTGVPTRADRRALWSGDSDAIESVERPQFAVVGIHRTLST
jgi:hypothetical protein